MTTHHEVRDTLMLDHLHAQTSTDRTSKLRNKGFGRRNLGPVQMTTDTAVRVTRTVIKSKSKHLEALELHSLTLPKQFRWVKYNMQTFQRSK